MDFDGASLNVGFIFGVPGIGTRVLSPLSIFLAGWGLTPADEDAVIDAILATVEENFDSLRLAGLNGDFPTDHVPGHFDVEVRNSRDHPDPVGQPNVSWMIVGGTVSQLGIFTIGIAQFIDPGNFSRQDTGVVLLDFLSDPPNGNPVCCSLNDIPRAPGVSIIDLIGVAVGNIVSHEAGHYLGCWHTDSFNGTFNIMDEGGMINDFSGVGSDGIFGNADDIDVDFVTDVFTPQEPVGFGTERTAVRTAFALSTGGMASVVPTIQSIFPPRDAELGNVTQVSVVFSEAVNGIDASLFEVNGSSATDVSGGAAGPYLFTGFASPGDGPVNVDLLGGAEDSVGNAFVGDAWTYRIVDCNGNGRLDREEIADGTGEDCNQDQLVDDCDPNILRARQIPTVELNTADTVALGALAPITGGTQPLIYDWTLRGNVDGEDSADPNPMFRPIGPGTYVVRVIVTDSGGCQAVNYLTIRASGDADPLPPPPAPFESMDGNCPFALTGAAAMAVGFTGFAGWRRLGRRRASARRRAP